MNIFQGFPSNSQEDQNYERSHRHPRTEQRAMGNRSSPEENKTHQEGESMKNLKNKRGQGLVEYILIVALMGILCIVAINALSTKTQSGYNAATTKLTTEFAKIGG
jgi:Flp pilus assembly pilin Flp